MRDKEFFEGDVNLPPDKPGDYCLRTPDKVDLHHARARVAVGYDEPRRRSHVRPPFAVRPASGRRSQRRRRRTPRPRDSASEHLWLLVSLQQSEVSLFTSPSTLTESVRRTPVYRRKDDKEQFHNSEVDVFDLYNATNGLIGPDGLLDVNQLYEYTPQEAEDLNVPRLIEIWHHTKDCPECARIVQTLNAVRGTLSEDVDEQEEEEEPFDEEAEASDADVIDSIS